MKKFLIIIVSILAVSGVLLGINKMFFTEKTAKVATTRNNAGLTVTDQRVFDDADLLSDSEEEQLANIIKEERQKSHADIIAVTTDDAIGKTSMAYADDFYDTHDFGYEDSHGTGILILIDMDNREIWLSTSGDCMKYIDSNRVDQIIDKVYGNLTSGDYYSTFTGCVKAVDGYMYQKNTVSPFILLAIALILAGGITAYLVFNRGGKVTVDSDTYLVAASKELTNQSDILYDTVRTTRTIESSSGGGGSHTSSGGFSHGGGGRSF